jgi:pimeloyl-ACP methyl ester carboxylesterase
VAVGAADAGDDAARLCPQRDILEPLGSGDRRQPPDLPPGFARLRPLGYAGRELSFHPDQIAAQVLAVLDALSLPRVHWVGESSGGLVGLLLAASHPRRIASLVLCNTPTRISNEIRGIYSLDQDSTAAAIRAYGTGEWCRRTLGYRLDLDHASAELREWCVAEMDKTRPDIAAALHECFEGVDVVPVLPEIQAPVLLLSGDKSRIASEQQKILARTLPHGRLELFGGYGHGVNLLLPERCARAALDFWRQVEADGGS